MLRPVLGIPPLAALGLAFGFTALGVFVDLQRIGTVGTVFRALYFCGCVLAVTWVRRRNLFGPVVAPPLLLARRGAGDRADGRRREPAPTRC